MRAAAAGPPSGIAGRRRSAALLFVVVAGERLDPETYRWASDLLQIPVIDHCEEPTLASGGAMNEGVVSARLGLKGIPNEAEEIMVIRDILLARRTGGHVHLALGNERFRTAARTAASASGPIRSGVTGMPRQRHHAVMAAT